VVCLAPGEVVGLGGIGKSLTCLRAQGLDGGLQLYRSRRRLAMKAALNFLFLFAQQDQEITKRMT